MQKEWIRRGFCGVVLISLMAALLVVVGGCKDVTIEETSSTGQTTESVAVDTTQAGQTTESVAVDTTQAAQTSSDVAVTNETGQFPCAIVDIFSDGGRDYIVVDFIDFKGDPDAGEEIVNNNPKLRTFLLPADARVSDFYETANGDMGHRSISVEDLKQAVAAGEAILSGGTYRPLGNAGAGFWFINVESGRVTSMEEGGVA